MTNVKRQSVVVCANDEQWRAYVESRGTLTYRNRTTAEGENWRAIRYDGPSSLRGRRFHEAVFLDGWQIHGKNADPLHDISEVLVP